MRGVFCPLPISPGVWWRKSYAWYPRIGQADSRKSTRSCPSRQALRTGGKRERADFGGRGRLRQARPLVFRSSRCCSPTFSVSAACPPKSFASFAISPTGSPATCARCDLRHSADLKNVPHPINPPKLIKKTALGGMRVTDYPGLILVPCAAGVQCGPAPWSSTGGYQWSHRIHCPAARR